MNTRTCIACGNSIIGRTDKKYCSDHCRYLENNKNKAQSEGTVLETNKILRKNRMILKTLCPSGKATVRREVLELMGYDVAVFSSLFLTTNRQVYYICYDFAFTPLIDKGVEKALIVTRQHYMNGWNPWKFIRSATNEKAL